MTVHLLKSIRSIEIAYEIKRVIDIEFDVDIRFQFNLKIGGPLISMNQGKVFPPQPKIAISGCYTRRDKIRST